MEWEDFAQYVADYGMEYEKYLDAHFQPIFAACDPCSLPFNYIAKLETFDEGTGLQQREDFSKVMTFLLPMLKQ